MFAAGWGVTGMTGVAGRKAAAQINAAQNKRGAH